MRTTATNKKLRVILSAIQNGSLVPNPDFQRRLVWSMKDKNAFLRTVLGEYPFPEIYVAAGSVNPETAEGSEMLVDGQQRITTLYQYFKGAKELRLEPDVTPYQTLKDDPERLRAFLEYEVVVRDLGQVSKPEIIEVFRRINSTKYSLNAVEIHNARFDGEFKRFAESILEHDFFETNRIFTPATVRRMGDLRFVMTVVATLMSSYFNRDDALEEFLENFNDEFPESANIRTRLDSVFEILQDTFEPKSRALSEVNLLPIIVEVERAKSFGTLKEDNFTRLKVFFQALTSDGHEAPSTSPMGQYFSAQRYATADRSNRMKRGRIVREVLEGLDETEWFATRKDDGQD